MRERPADTTPEADAKYRAIMRERSAEDRLKMACEMFQAARRLIVATLPPHIAADPLERRIAVLMRTYGHDLAPELLARIADDFRRRT